MKKDNKEQLLERLEDYISHHSQLRVFYGYIVLNWLGLTKPITILIGLPVIFLAIISVFIVSVYIYCIKLKRNIVALQY